MILYLVLLWSYMTLQIAVLINAAAVVGLISQTVWLLQFCNFYPFSFLFYVLCYTKLASVWF